jgi:hypothetical protein
MPTSSQQEVRWVILLACIMLSRHAIAEEVHLEVGAVSCIACHAGTYADKDGLGVCLECAPGYFSNGTGAESCQPCPAGTFVDSHAAQNCTPCPFGTFSDRVAAPSVLVCQQCTAETASHRMCLSIEGLESEFCIFHCAVCLSLF